MTKHYYKKGDRIRLIKLRGADFRYDINAGDEFEVDKVTGHGSVWCWLSSGEYVRFLRSQIEPVTNGHIAPVPTEREQRIRQMAHEYVVAELTTGNSLKPRAVWFIELATELHDTPIPPPPSKP